MVIVRTRTRVGTMIPGILSSSKHKPPSELYAGNVRGTFSHDCLMVALSDTTRCQYTGKDVNQCTVDDFVRLVNSVYKQGYKM